MGEAVGDVVSSSSSNSLEQDEVSDDVPWPENTLYSTLPFSIPCHLYMEDRLLNPHYLLPHVYTTITAGFTHRWRIRIDTTNLVVKNVSLHLLLLRIQPPFQGPTLEPMMKVEAQIAPSPVPQPLYSKRLNLGQRTVVEEEPEVEMWWTAWPSLRHPRSYRLSPQSTLKGRFLISFPKHRLLMDTAGRFLSLPELEEMGDHRHSEEFLSLVVRGPSCRPIRRTTSAANPEPWMELRCADNRSIYFPRILCPLITHHSAFLDAGVRETEKREYYSQSYCLIYMEEYKEEMVYKVLKALIGGTWKKPDPSLDEMEELSALVKRMGMTESDESRLMDEMKKVRGAEEWRLVQAWDPGAPTPETLMALEEAEAAKFPLLRSRLLATLLAAPDLPAFFRDRALKKELEMELVELLNGLTLTNTDPIP